MNEPILKIEDLRVIFDGQDQQIEAVGGVSLELMPGEILGVVGESGSGKSTLCLSVMNLFQGTSARIAGGSIFFNGHDLCKATSEEMRLLRGKEVSMIFQEPMTSLNPVMSVEKHLFNALRVHNPSMTKPEIRARSLELLTMVGISDAEKRIRDYPHQLSGGMRQRVMIAMALANRPKLLLCDEPTTALDVTIQAQVLQLIRNLSRQEGSSVLFITHAMGVIAQIADRVAVMYSGQIMESGLVREIFRMPMHPYTRGLLDAIPRLDIVSERLYSIPGTVSVRTPGQTGCPFASRCSRMKACCQYSNPPEIIREDHHVRCFFPIISD